MSPTTQELHTPSTPQEKIPLLVVSPLADDFSSVRRIFQNACWQVDYAKNLDAAGKLLHQKGASVVLCERDLPDGTWKDLLPRIGELPVIPSLLVVSRHADDDLWADVLSCGGYDVLPKPFDRAEMVRVVSMAWRFCYTRNASRRKSCAPRSMPATAS